jgi:hypothetical protein
LRNVTDFEQIAIDAVIDDFAHAADIAGYDGRAVPHGLDQNEPEALESTGRDEHIGSRVMFL